MDTHEKHIKDEIKRLEELKKDLTPQATQAEVQLNKMRSDLLGIDYQLGELKRILELAKESVKEKK